MKISEKKIKSISFFIAGFLILSAIIFATGYLYYRYEIKSYRVKIDQELSAIADLKVKEIIQWREERIGDISVFNKNNLFSSLVQRYFEKPDDAETLEEIQMWLENVQKQYDYKRIFLMDANGIERLSIPSSSIPVASIVSLRHSEIMKSKQIVFEDFYRNEHDNQICLAVLAPIMDRQDSSHVLGILSLQIDPVHYLYPLISSWPTPSKTSETLLLRREGNEVVFLNDLKFQKNAALNLRAPMNGTIAIPAIKAALGEEGIVEGLDYRGVPVIAAIRTIHGSPWFMVTRMDQSEAFAPLKERLLIIVILVSLLFIIIGGVFYFFWKQQNLKFYREKFEASAKLITSEEKFRLLFDTIPDAIFIHDLEGHFLQVNDVACKRLGYSNEELLKMTVKEIDSPKFAEKFEALIKPFLETGKAVLETEHMRRDGVIIPTELSSRVIKYADKPAVLSVARDITERKQAEKALREAKNVLEIRVKERTGELQITNEQLDRNYQIQKVLNSLLQVSLEDISFDELLKQALDLILSIPLLSVESKGSIFLVEEKPEILILKVQKGFEESLQKDCAWLPFGKCLCGRAALTQEIQFASSLDERHEIRYEGIAPHGHYCVPIVAAGKTLGVINLYLKEGYRHDLKDEEFLTAISNTLAGIILRKQMEEMILEERGLFIDGAAVVFKWKAREGMPVEYVSPNILARFGYTAEDFTSGKILFSDIIHPDDLPRLDEEVKQYSLSGIGSFEQEYRIARADGEYRWLYDFTVVRRDESGTITHFHGYVIDITGRKHAENQKRRQSEILESITKESPLPQILELIAKSVEEEYPSLLCSILLLDAEGKHLQNGAAPSLPEFYNQAIHGLEIGEKVGSCGAAAYLKKRIIAEDLLTHPNWIPYRELTQRANLRACWSEPILDAKDNVLGTFAIYSHQSKVPQSGEIELLESVAYLTSLAITRKKAEEEIRNLNANLEKRIEERTEQLEETNRNLTTQIKERKKAEAQLVIQSTALNAAANTIVITDRDGHIEWVNSAFTKLTGYSLEEVSGENPRSLKSGKHDSAFYKNLWDTILDGKVWSGEIINKRKDGSEYTEEMTITPLKDENGEITRFVSVKQDITARKRAETTLRGSEELFRAVTQSANDAIITSNSKGIILGWNRSAEKIFGYTEKEVTGKEVTIIMPRHYVEQHNNGIKRVVQGGAHHVIGKTVELHGLHKNGNEFPVELSLATWETASGKFFTGTIRDITERKKAEEALHSIEWLLHPMKFHEEPFKPVYGDTTRLNTNRTILDAVGEETLNNIVTEFMNLLGTSIAVYEKNGDYSAGIFSSGWCRYLDRASFELCKTDNLHNALNSGKWLCHESCWTEGAKKAMETGQITDIECHGGTHLYTVPIHINNEIVGAINFGYGNPPRDIETLSEIASKYNVNIDELKRLSNEYETRPQFIIDLAKNRLEGAAQIIALMVQSKRAEDAMKVSRTEAEQANKTKSDFLARMSHEIRTPLNAIIGMIHLTLQTSLDKKQKDKLQKIQASGKALLSIVNDILDFSKIEAGKLDLEQEEFDLEKVFQNLTGVIMHKAHEKNLEIVIKQPRTVPNILTGDPLRLGQILLNLSVNAIKFTEKGEIVINAELEQKKNGKVKILFRIKDTGIGLSKQEAGRLFQSFSQADVSTTRKYGGTGLGLAICKSLTEMMGGEIWVESKKGQGSTFFFTAWFGLGKQQKTREFAPAVDLNGVISENLLKQVQGSLVLLVEDNEMNQDVAVGMLEAAGVQTEVADNGKKAVEMVRTSGKPSKYELVFMDLQMPEMDGYDATCEIRKLKYYRNLSIIAMTADAITGVKEKCLKAGMNDFIAKPIDPAKFYSTLAKWIKHGKARKGKNLNSPIITETGHIVKIHNIEGLDAEDGLRRINNNTDLYLKLLGKFSKNYSNFISELNRSLKEGLITEAGRMVHTLKGVSGNIGATDLHSFTVILDEKIKKHEKIDIDSEISALDNLLTPILNSIDQVLSKEKVPEIEHQKGKEEDLDKVKFRKLLDELSVLLGNSDFDSAKKADELKNIKGIGKYAEEIRKIREYISDYEFDEATKVVDKLIKIV